MTRLLSRLHQINYPDLRKVPVSVLAFTLILFSRSLPALDLRVNIEGLDGPQQDNVRAYLSIFQEREREGLNKSRMKLLHQRAESEIREALQPFGYFKAQVQSELEAKQDYYLATYRVDPGPKVRISQVEVEINGEGAGLAQLETGFTIKSGQRLSQPEYEKAKQALLSKALQLGFLDARYTHSQLRVSMQPYAAAISLTLDTGAHSEFGEVRFIQDFMNPSFLQRYVEFSPGDRFDQNQVLKLQSDLVDTQYFSDVEIKIRREQMEERRVPIDILLNPNRPNRYRVGLGFSTDVGPRLTLDHNRRRIGENGKHMHSELTISEKHQSITGEFIVPLERPTKDFDSFGATHERDNLETHQSSLTLLSAKRSISLDNNWRRTIGLDYSYEDFEVGEQDDDMFFLSPNIRWTQLSTDNLQYSQWGHSLDFYFEGGSDRVLSSANYAQLNTTFKLIYGFGDRQWRLIPRVNLGATWVEELMDLPASKRFFAGGDNSIRGFDLDRLGPVDDNGDVVGGRYLGVASLELERRISGPWSGAVFYDYGNAFDPDYDSEPVSGVGIGVRWHSPVGPIRFDLAKGIMAHAAQYRIHIVIGPSL